VASKGKTVSPPPGADFANSIRHGWARALSGIIKKTEHIEMIRNNRKTLAEKLETLLIR
jgi:hypothetical protein